jgi:hypothetical protein
MRKIARLINKLADRCERWRYGNACGCGGCGYSSPIYPTSGCGGYNPCG